MLLYEQFAEWWPLMSPPEDYAEEAAFYLAAMTRALGRPPDEILELGSGGGNNASHLKRQAAMVLVEPAAGMREVSRALNPDLEHVAGDMRTVRLDRQFDAVFVHDAVCYLTSQAELEQAIATAAAHCRPGGVVLFAPDYVRETFVPGEECGGRDAPDGRGLRYLEWMWDPDPADDTYTVEYVLLMRDAQGEVRSFHERHREGVFPRAAWLRLLSGPFTRVASIPLDLSDIDPGTHEVFAGIRR